jgi:hypothetical protein
MVVVTAVWLLAMSAVLILLARYSARTGTVATPPTAWPAESALVPGQKVATLLVFAHPRCPCTRATLRELELLLAQCEGAVKTFVIFNQPEGTSSAWTETDLWRSARQMRDVNAFCDRGGLETKRFQAETSGASVLYDRNGRLAFSGGITLARGHSGDNPGRSALTKLIRGTRQERVNTPVFGCPLFNEDCGNEVADE